MFFCMPFETQVLGVCGTPVTLRLTFCDQTCSNNKELLCITHTDEHKYISPSSTVGIQLHVSALYVGHLQVVI